MLIARKQLQHRSDRVFTHSQTCSGVCSGMGSSRIPASASDMDNFFSLQDLQDVTRLMMLNRPPAERGIRWSTVRLYGRSFFRQVVRQPQ